MSRSRRRKKAKSLISLRRVKDEGGLNFLRYWLRPMAFDRADAMTSRAGEPSVKISFRGQVVAGVICADERLQNAAENIAAAVLIWREDHPNG
jgi:hypothetical protein